MKMYVYIGSQPGLYTVGFYDPSGVWQPESDHESAEDAAERVAWLNGSGRHITQAVRLSADDLHELKNARR
jgi:hypothetical protein